MAESNYRARLRRLVKTIQEVKAENEYLVGSQDVWNLLKERESVYKLPIQSSNSINWRLGEKFPEVTYRSTPERLNGLNEFFESDGLHNSSSPRELIARVGVKFFEDNSIVDVDVTESYLPIFINANRAQITFDGELGDIVAATIQEGYDKVKSKLDSDDNERCEEYVRKKMDESKLFDWIKKCSLREFSSFERSHLKRLAEDRIDFVEMVERAQNELIDHRLHTKRAILSNYLSRDGGFIGQIGKDFGYSPTWNSVKLDCESQITSLDYDLRNPERFYRDMRELNANNNEVIRIMETKRKTLNALKYLRQIIGSEKNWITKILKN